MSDEETSRKTGGQGSTRAVWIIFGVALLLRIFVAVPGLPHPEIAFFRPDTPTYLDPARALVDDGRFLEEPGSDTPATLRPPGYPVFLAAILALGGGRLEPLVHAGCLVSALGIFPVYYASLLLAGPVAASVAALLIALNMTSIAAAPMILADSLYALLVAIQFYFFARFCTTGRLSPFWIAATVAGLACLVRPIGQYWILPGILLLVAFPRLPWNRRLLGALVAGVLFLAAVVPWMLRNEDVGAGFRIDTNTGNTLLDHTVVAILSVATGESGAEIRARVRAEAAAEFAAHPDRYRTERSKVDYQMRTAWSHIRRHLPVFVLLHLQPLTLLPDAPTLLEHFGVTRTGRGTTDVLWQKGLVAAARNYFGDRIWVLGALLPLLLVVALTYLGAAVRLGAWILRRRWYLLLAFLAFSAYFLVLPGPIVAPRYQLPALPLLATMAGRTAEIWWRRRHTEEARADASRI